MKVVKTDGIIPVPADWAGRLAAIGAELVEATALDEASMIAACADADAIMVLREPVSAPVITALGRCKVVTRFGIGVDTIDLAAAATAGIAVTNVPDANIEEVATHALALALALDRRLVALDNVVRAGQFGVLSVGQGMRRQTARTFGVLGLGKIGGRVAARAVALGYQVIAHDPFGTTPDGVEAVALDALIARSDILSLHVPLTADTANIIDAAAIARMPAGAMLVNVSRGGLVDEEALAKALHEGRLSGAGLDTFAVEPLPADSPLRDAPNLLLSPHAAHFSGDSFAELMEKAFVDVLRVLSGEPPLYRVA